MHKKILIVLKTMIIAFFSFMLLVISSSSFAQSKIIPVEGMRYNINTSMKDNLMILTGKRVTLTLDGGKILTGIVKSVGDNLVHLKKIEQKEFYDSLIRLKSIQAVEARFRTKQR